MSADAFGVSYTDIVSRRNTQTIKHARYVAVHVAVATLPLTQSELARYFDRDRTAMGHAIKAAAALIEAESHIRRGAERLIAAVEYRNTVVASQSVDVLAMARRIAVDPRGGAIGASMTEIAALACAFCDLWEVASAAELLIEDLRHCEIQTTDNERADRIGTVVNNISVELNRIAGPAASPAEPPAAGRS